MWPYSLTWAAPPAEPLTLEEIKLHLRIDSDITVDDALIEGLIVGAREWVENYIRRSLVIRDVTLRLDAFPGVILLPRGPVQSVTKIEVGTFLVPAASYQVDLHSLPARIAPAGGGAWPAVPPLTMSNIVVTYVGGYPPEGTAPDQDYAANIPEAIKVAMKLLVGGLYENREHVAEKAQTEVPFSVRALLAPFEVRDFAVE